MNPAPSTIRVVLADDHNLIRSGVRSLLSAIKGVEVIGEVGDGQELLDLLESVQPDLIFMDLAMPGMDGLTAITRVQERYPALPVIVLSMQEGTEAIKRAVAAGARGYIRKDAPNFELEMALRSVLSTGRYFSSAVTQRLLAASEPAAEDLLTERQIQILTLLARGKSSKEIAFELGLSSKTVDVHRARLMERLEIRDVASLTLYAVRKGFVKP